MGHYLSRDDILNAQDLPTEMVDVPEWGGAVTVRGLNGQEREELDRMLFSRTGKKPNTKAALVALSAVDEQGERLFTLEDVEALSLKSGAALDRVFEAAQRLSGLTRASREELRKN